ncbi:MAG: hypothetical protein LBU81_01855 [Methanosarcinales archaeon]|jgi:hypothetical protein|nr:hypothetical protein [Methanosarcinales archaeon]
MVQDLATLCRDLGTILEMKESVSLLEIVALTEEKQLRIKAVIDLLMLKDKSIEVKGTTYTYKPIKQDAIVLYLVFTTNSIVDSFYFDPEEPSPTAAEIAEKNFVAAFRDENEAMGFAHNNGFQVLKIEEFIPEEDDERLLVI